MTAAERARLARILGMLGSEHAGERASAALQAEAFRKRHGLTWEGMLVLPPVEPEPKPDPEMAARQAHWGAEDAARKATWRAKQHAEQPWQAPPGKGERSSPPRTHAVLSYEVWVTSGLCLAGFIVFGTTLTIVQALTH